jgi:Cu2+-containing amine oxidase
MFCSAGAAAAAAGTVHTHVLAWKVDLDIAGTSNSLNMINFKVGGYTAS